MLHWFVALGGIERLYVQYCVYTLGPDAGTPQPYPLVLLSCTLTNSMASEEAKGRLKTDCVSSKQMCKTDANQSSESQEHSHVVETAALSVVDAKLSMGKQQALLKSSMS